MNVPTRDDGETVLHTTVGDFPLHEYRLRLGGREWSVLHAGAVLGFWDEQRFLSEERNRHAYGVALWPASIALAHDVTGSDAATEETHFAREAIERGVRGGDHAASAASHQLGGEKAVAACVAERAGAPPFRLSALGMRAILDQE